MFSFYIVYNLFIIPHCYNIINLAKGIFLFYYAIIIFYYCAKFYRKKRKILKIKSEIYQSKG